MTQLEIVKKALNILGGFSEREDENGNIILDFGAYSWTENLWQFNFVFGKYGEYLETIENQCDFYSEDNY